MTEIVQWNDIESQILIGNVKKKLAKLELDNLVFFDSQSAGCWIHPTA